MNSNSPIQNISLNSSTSITIVAFPNSAKLNPKICRGYLKQIEAILKGLGLMKFANGSHSPHPFQTIASGDTTATNPAYEAWYR